MGGRKKKRCFEGIERKHTDQPASLEFSASCLFQEWKVTEEKRTSAKSIDMRVNKNVFLGFDFQNGEKIDTRQQELMKNKVNDIGFYEKKNDADEFINFRL